MSLQPILYAEDEENDAFFLRRAFTAAEIPNPLVVVPDGQEAIHYCGGLGAGASGNPPPCLILLDLNMPIKSGIDVLEWIRQASPIANVPVIILSSSLQPYDIQVAYSRGANAYLVKPSVPDELIAMARSIKDFWLDRNRSVPG